ncbi:hypothetical protein A0U87_01900 [Sphingobium sp. MP9-4]|jgi:hypothetical protein|uniref:hypothetical protein n=1 Tax=Sphingobium sp. MP9-4 TaxID=1761936 RepID=UPI0010CA71C6|nr:hypothetical protein [Sphingobium sp. MP9-4]TKV43167.1 hypothetical protein A0U87_01900 [Sphingobium sp. MP9-4]
MDAETITRRSKAGTALIGFIGAVAGTIITIVIGYAAYGAKVDTLAARVEAMQKVTTVDPIVKSCVGMAEKAAGLHYSDEIDRVNDAMKSIGCDRLATEKPAEF